MEKLFKSDFWKYVPSIDQVDKVGSKFNCDFYSNTYDENKNFSEYLCALAMGTMSWKLYEDLGPVMNYGTESLYNKHPEFAQGMLTHMMIENYNKAKGYLYDLKDETMVLDFAKDKNNFASIAFTLFYLHTNGYTAEWNKMNHAYCAINLDYNTKISFVKTKPIEDVKGLINSTVNVANKKQEADLER